MNIEKAVKIARETVAEKGLQLGEIELARFFNESDEWCVSSAIIQPPNKRILPSNVIVLIDNETGQARLPPMI